MKYRLVDVGDLLEEISRHRSLTDNESAALEHWLNKGERLRKRKRDGRV